MKHQCHRVISRISISLGVLFSATIASAQSNESSGSRALAEELGSLTNAKVAVEMPEAKKKQLTYFARSMSKGQLDELSKIAPNVRIVAGLSPQEAMQRAEEAHGIDGRYASDAFISKAKNLRWVQISSAGVDRYLGIKPLMENDAIVMCNSRAVHGPAIADHSMAMLLYLTRNLDFYAANQKDGKWVRREGKRKSVALKGKTMLVVGLGGIGSEIAHRAHGFGMNVIGTRRSDKPSPAYIKRVGKPKDLLEMLPEADVVALAVPLTDETKNLIDEKAFTAMKQGSYLINIARGKVVNSDAMLKALQSGKLAGAGLDVTDPEPLPEGHELWKQPNVIITPHIASRSEVTTQRRAALMVENMRRFGAGEPLLNVVDKEAGY